MSDWVIGFVEERGYFGILLLMVAENVFPPLPSELIVPFAGFVAARGELNFVGVVIAASLGSAIGALPWYAAGRWLGCERLKRFAARHGQWLTMTPKQIDRVQRWFHDRGPLVLVFGRLVPALRTLISLPAGISGLPLGKFIAWTLVGTTLWTGALTAAGFLMKDSYERISSWLNPLTTAIMVGLVLWYVLRVVRYHGKGQGGDG